jgi:tripartite-type tricarboxylate transporter receptor subunit TctC
MAPALYRNVGYDPIKSFAPVVMIARSHQILFVNPAVPAKSVQELVAYAKGNPGKVHFDDDAIELDDPMGWEPLTHACARFENETVSLMPEPVLP